MNCSSRREKGLGKRLRSIIFQDSLKERRDKIEEKDFRKKRHLFLLVWAAWPDDVLCKPPIFSPSVYRRCVYPEGGGGTAPHSPKGWPTNPSGAANTRSLRSRSPCFFDVTHVAAADSRKKEQQNKTKNKIVECYWLLAALGLSSPSNWESKTQIIKKSSTGKRFSLVIYTPLYYYVLKNTWRMGGGGRLSIWTDIIDRVGSYCCWLADWLAGLFYFPFSGSR